MGLLGNVVGSLKKVVASAFGIFKLAKPLLEKLGLGMDEIEKVMAETKEVLDGGGAELKDDFIDMNIDTVIMIENVSGRGVAVLQKLNTAAAKLRVYSQEMTPNQITATESNDIEQDLDEFVELLMNWKPELEQAVKALGELEH